MGSDFQIPQPVKLVFGFVKISVLFLFATPFFLILRGNICSVKKKIIFTFIVLGFLGINLNSFSKNSIYRTEKPILLMSGDSNKSPHFFSLPDHYCSISKDQPINHPIKYFLEENMPEESCDGPAFELRILENSSGSMNLGRLTKADNNLYKVSHPDFINKKIILQSSLSPKEFTWPEVKDIMGPNYVHELNPNPSVNAKTYIYKDQDVEITRFVFSDEMMVISFKKLKNVIHKEQLIKSPILWTVIDPKGRYYSDFFYHNESINLKTGPISILGLVDDLPRMENSPPRTRPFGPLKDLVINKGLNPVPYSMYMLADIDVHQYRSFVGNCIPLAF